MSASHGRKCPSSLRFQRYGLVEGIKNWCRLEAATSENRRRLEADAVCLGIFVDFALIGITVLYTASFMRVVPGDSFVLQTVTRTAEQVKDNR